MAAPTLRLPGATEPIIMSGRVGDVIMRITDTPPPHTLECNGAAVSRTTYAKLFAELGTSQGVGDGSTTFNLPDLRNRWLRGSGDDAPGTSIAEGLPDINGTIGGEMSPVDNGFDGAYKAATPGNYVGAVDGTSIAVQTVFFHASRANAIYGSSAHVTPVSKAVMFCIIYE